MCAVICTRSNDVIHWSESDLSDACSRREAIGTSYPEGALGTVHLSLVAVAACIADKPFVAVVPVSCIAASRPREACWLAVLGFASGLHPQESLLARHRHHFHSLRQAPEHSNMPRVRVSLAMHPVTGSQPT